MGLTKNPISVENIISVLIRVARNYTKIQAKKMCSVFLVLF